MILAVLQLDQLNDDYITTFMVWLRTPAGKDFIREKQWVWDMLFDEDVLELYSTADQLPTETRQSVNGFFWTARDSYAFDVTDVESTCTFDSETITVEIARRAAESKQLAESAFLRWSDASFLDGKGVNWDDTDVEGGTPVAVNDAHAVGAANTCAGAGSAVAARQGPPDDSDYYSRNQRPCKRSRREATNAQRDAYLLYKEIMKKAQPQVYQDSSIPACRKKYWKLIEGST